MYWRYQQHEKASWFPIVAGSEEEALKLALQSGAKKLTVLSTNTLITDDSSESDILSARFKGPLYFDLDLKNELGTVIESARELVSRLTAMRVPAEAIEIYLSGSKGLHIMVPAQYFSSASSSYKMLPLVYKEMAKELYVPGLDFSVYSARKGNSWRIKNVKRDDGNFRVPITYDELKTLTEVQYRDLVKQPREIAYTQPKDVKSAELSALFEEARKKVGEKPRQQVILLSDAVLAEIKHQAPPCIKELCSYNRLRTDVNFNRAAMNLGAYIARTGADESLEDTLVNLLANNGRSSKYDSVRERLYHTRGAVAYAKATERLSFSCNAMRALLTVRPCDGCQLETKGSTGSDDDDMGAIARENGYYNMTATGTLRRMTNFVLQPEEVLNEIQQDGTITRRKATRTKVVKNSETLGMVVLGEETFAGRSSFIKSLEGITGIVFEGSDSDVQRIKKTFDDAASDVGEIMLTYTCGILIDQVDAGEGNSVEVRTYVEPHHSINSVKRTNTHDFHGKLTHKPHLFEAAMPKENDEIMDYALWNLLNTNTPETVAALVGWHVACHFKSHLMRRFQQFPILSIWGNAGAGKSMTSSLFTWLNGTDYHGMGMDSGVNLTSITEYALREYVSNVTTIPRVLEEFNKSKIQQQSRSMYTTIHEMIKASWGGETVLRGTLGGGRSKGRIGANVIETNITAPLIVISEQRLDTDAIRQRSVRIELTEKKRAGRKDFYEQAKLHRDKIRVFAKALMFKALMTDSLDVYERINSYAELVPPKLQDRPRYSLQIILMGLQLCAEVMESLGLNKSLEMLQECREIFTSGMKREDKVEKPKSEVDEVICDIGLLVTLNNPLLRDANNKGQVQLQENVDYLVEYPFLFLDPVLIHAKYIQYYKNTRGQQPVIDKADQFSLLLRQESYFEEEVKHAGWLTHRNVFRLSIPKMGEKNIDQTLFSPVEEIQW